MVRETKGPGIVMTIGYTNGEKLVEIPPKEKTNDNLKIEFMTLDLLQEMEENNEIMTLCGAERLSEKATAKVKSTKRNGITEIPASKMVDRDDGR